HRLGPRGWRPIARVELEHRHAHGPVDAYHPRLAAPAVAQDRLDPLAAERMTEGHGAVLGKHEARSTAGAASEGPDAGFKRQYLRSILQHASNIAASARGQRNPPEGSDPLEGRNPPEGEDLSAVTAACEILGDRWSLPLVAALLAGPLRYGELQDRLPAIAPNILPARLRKLEEAGLVVSLRYSARPPRFEYLLSPDGAALADAVRALGAWAGRREGAGHAPRHAACGTELEVRWWCP